jgi:hypothetical protein
MFGCIKLSKVELVTKTLKLSKTYLVHANGGRPFKVVLKNVQGRVKVDVMKQTTDFKAYEKEPCWSAFSEEVFVANHDTIPKVGKPKWRRGDPLDVCAAVGHVVVVKTGHLKYVFVGHAIQEFKTLAPVTRIESYVGNSDLPYPCVVDSQHNVYLLLESVVMKHVTKKQIEPFGDVYGFYYAKKCLCRGRSTDNRGVGFEGIQTFYVNNNYALMYFAPFPKQEYKRLTSKEMLKDMPNQGPDKTLHNTLAIKVNNKVSALSERDYVAVMKRFAKQMNFQGFKLVTLVEPMVEPSVH